MYFDDFYKEHNVLFLKEYQPIDVIRRMPYNLGSAIKYLIKSGYSEENLNYVYARDYLKDVLHDADKSCHIVLNLNIDVRQALSVYVSRNNLLATLFLKWTKNKDKLKVKKVQIDYQDILNLINTLNKKIKNNNELNDE